MSFPSLLTCRHVGGVMCHIIAKADVVQAYVAGKKVWIKGLPPSISPHHVASARELLNSTKTSFSWDGTTITVVVALKGGGTDSEGSAQGDYDKAIDYYDLELVRNLNNLGALYASKCDYPRAIEHYIKAINRIGDAHPDAVPILASLGAVFYFQSNYPLAMENFNKALKVQRDTFRTGQPNEALILIGLGNVYARLGESGKAIDYYNKALAIQKQLFGESSSEVARSYNNLGCAYYIEKDFGNAIECHTKSLSIREKVFEERHPEVLMSLTNLGNTHHVQGIALASRAKSNHLEIVLEPQSQVLWENHLKWLVP